MTTPPDNQKEWRDCEPGELQSLANQLRRDASQRRSLRAAVPIALALCLLIGVGLFSAFIPSEPDYGGIACSDVKKLSDDFVNGLLREADAARIKLHLKKCEPCQRYIETLREQQNLARVWKNTPQQYSPDIDRNSRAFLSPIGPTLVLSSQTY